MPLVEFPLILSIADWVWGANESELVTPEICLNSIPWLSSGCLMGLIVKGLGIAIILGSFLNKAPIMINVIKSKSVAGLSLAGFYGEVIVYFNCAFYGYLNSYPISAYGENIALGLQTIMLVTLMWELQSGVSIQERILAIGIFMVYTYVVLQVLPSELYYTLMASIWPVMVFSRGSQILKTHQLKHTGAQSILTMTMNLVGGLIRILTTIQEVGWDFNVLNGFILSVGLNSTMFAQYWMYRQNTVQFLADLKKTQEKKTE